VTIAPAGCFTFDYGKYGLYKAVLPRTAKVTCLPAITYQTGSPPVTKHTSMIAREGNLVCHKPMVTLTHVSMYSHVVCGN
jgi:hypothetical protein